MPKDQSSVVSRQSSEFRGFTLVELMIAVSIIAILATIGLTVYSGVQKGARDSKRQSDIQEMQKALEQYYSINRTYPLSASDSTTLAAGIGGYFNSGALPQDPKGINYNYISCSSADKYVLCNPVSGGSSTMETCGTNHKNCNAVAPIPTSGNGCGTFSSNAATNNYFCVGSLSN